MSLVLYGSLVKRLRRRPLTAETGVRFPYELHYNRTDTALPIFGRFLYIALLLSGAPVLQFNLYFKDK